MIRYKLHFEGKKMSRLVTVVDMQVAIYVYLRVMVEMANTSRTIPANRTQFPNILVKRGLAAQLVADQL